MNRDLAKENNKRKYEVESFGSTSNNEEQEWITIVPKKSKVNLPNKKLYQGIKTNFDKFDKFEETWNQYLITLNYYDTKVNRKGEKNCDWIYRVLEGKQELNCVECVTEELLIIPPTGKPLSELVKLNPEKFHILVIPFDRTIRTIRDLRSCHIPMLKRMRTKALEVIIVSLV